MRDGPPGRPARALLGLMALAGCGGPTIPSAAHQGQAACPAGMIFVEGGTFELGETLPENKPPVNGAWIPAGPFELGPFCIDRFPFPGVEGAPWPKDGLNYAAASLLEERVARYGRRLCTASEMLLGTAGPGNVRYFYGPAHQAGVCEGSEEAPRPLGSWPNCKNALGLRDHLVRSTWVRLDDPMERRLAPESGPPRPPHLGLARPEGIELAVMGGTPRLDTFYASSNFGIHAHAPDLPTRFLDDGVRLCASVGAARSGWQEEIARFRETDRYGAWLGIDHGTFRGPPLQPTPAP